jgi:hypothetical protein
MLSGFVMRRWLRFLPLFLLVIAFVGCGMMSVLVDEDAGEDTDDAGSSTDASDEDAPPDSCGDGIIQGELGEACEAGNTGGATCSSMQMGTGVLLCNDRCEFDFSLCTGPGGGVGDGGVVGDGGFSPFGDGGFLPTRRDGGRIF